MQLGDLTPVDKLIDNIRRLAAELPDSSLQDQDWMGIRDEIVADIEELPPEYRAEFDEIPMMLPTSGEVGKGFVQPMNDPKPALEKAADRCVQIRDFLENR
jgi:hypothetical protein